MMVKVFKSGEKIAIRTTINLVTASDVNPGEEAERRALALAERAKTFGFDSFSELARAFADNKIDVIPNRRRRNRQVAND
jgi:hypothetical protein